MAISGAGPRFEGAIRRAASEWVALTHDPDAEIDRGALDRWCAADPRHRAAYARAERAWIHAALLAETRVGRARQLPKRTPWFVRPQLRFALALITLTFGVVGLSLSTLLGGLSHRDDLVSQIGQIHSFKLSDGSLVTLDTDTVLRPAFTTGERRLYLTRGRARFDVQHDGARPFIVIAGGGSVTARGTLFDVSLFENRVRVALLRGVVEVRGTVHLFGPPFPAARLDAGQQLSFNPATALPNPQPNNPRATQWALGMLIFDRTRLGDAIADANRYSIRKIALADPALDDQRLTGAYRVGDPDGLAAAMAMTLGLRAGPAPDGGILLSARLPTS